MMGPEYLPILLSIFFLICPWPEICEESKATVLFNTWVPVLRLVNSSVFLRGVLVPCQLYRLGHNFSLMCSKCATIQT